jgi:ABC-2 type transport system permease protein
VSALARVALVARFEFLRQTRRPAFWIWLALMALHVGTNWWTIAFDEFYSSGRRHITSEFSQTAGILQLVVPIFYLFFTCIPAGTTILQDEEYRVGELLFTTSLRPREYVWGKFAGVMAASCAAILAHLLMRLFVDFVLPHPRNPHMVGAFHARNYFLPLFTFILPFVISMAAVAFALGEKTRRAAYSGLWASAVEVVGLLVIWAAPAEDMDPAWNRWLMWLDPMGYRYLWDRWHYTNLGADYYNNNPIPLEGSFIASRIAWVVFGFALVAWTGRHFARTSRGVARARSSSSPVAPAVVPRVVSAAHVTPPGLLKTTITIFLAELRALSQQTGLTLSIPSVLLLMAWEVEVRQSSLGLLPMVTSGWLAASSSDLLTIAMCLVLTFTIVDSVSRERTTRIATFHDALPFPTAGLLFGKYLANNAMMMLLGASALVTATLLVSPGSFELKPFLICWGLLVGPTVLAWSAFVLAIQAASGNRNLTYGITVGVLAISGWLLINRHMNWSLNWWLIATIQWTDLGAFELDIQSLLWNRFMVASSAFFFLALAVELHSRREGRRSYRITKMVPWAVVPLLAFVVLQYRVERSSNGPAVRALSRKYHQQHGSKWRAAPIPALEKLELDVELFPAERRFVSRGIFHLRNHRHTILSEIPLTAGVHWDEVSWTVNGREAALENQAQLIVVTPTQALAKGDRLRIGFTVSGRAPRGETEAGGGQVDFLTPSNISIGSFVPILAPMIGYDQQFEAMGLAPAERDRLAAELETASDKSRSAISVELPFLSSIRVTAPAEFVVNSVGTKVSDTVEGDRRTVLWNSESPVYAYNIAAARWSIRRGTNTTIYHHPEHTKNLEEIARALETAHRQYSEWFGELPWRELKLSEVSGAMVYAMGFPTNMVFSEQVGFVSESDPDSRGITFVVAHEVAHQWWGNRLLSARGPGNTVLIEGMANYVALLLVEQQSGKKTRIRMSESLERDYLRGRVADVERPLSKTSWLEPGGQDVIYNKGAMELWRLDAALGRENMLAGLREFLFRFEGRAEHPALDDLLTSLRARAPDVEAYDQLVASSFRELALPRYTISGVSREGSSLVFTVTNRGTGRIPITVAVERGERFSAQHREQRTTLILGPEQNEEVRLSSLPFEPERITVDPDVLVPQLDRKVARARIP